MPRVGSVVYNRNSPKERKAYVEATGKAARGDHTQPIGLDLDCPAPPTNVNFDLAPDFNGLFAEKSLTGEPDMTLDMQGVLKFSGSFECANLQIAYIKAPNCYGMRMADDTNTNGHTQWFYFAVRGRDKGVQVRFFIENFMKPASQYQHGMQICMHSKKSGKGWVRAGEDIRYFRNQVKVVQFQQTNTRDTISNHFKFFTLN